MAGPFGFLTRRLREITARRDPRKLTDNPLRDYEWALANIKALGYEWARLQASTALRPKPDGPQVVGLTSKICTQADIEAEWFSYWCPEIGVTPAYHRKLWELGFIIQALWERGMLAPGRSGIGFGCGREPLPSLFAKLRCDVLATDLPASSAAAHLWQRNDQHAVDIEAVRQRTICPDETKLKNIRFRAVDMNAIPEELDSRFDFCWSSCALDHLGSIDFGTTFVENSLTVMKPGSVAVHTFEFNLSEDENTVETGETVLFQRRHIKRISERLTEEGHKVARPDFNKSEGFLDRFVDLPPYDIRALQAGPQPAHLNVSIAGFRCTSFGLIIARGT